MSNKTIECPMKLVDIFPYGLILIPDTAELKKRLKKMKMKRELCLNCGKLRKPKKTKKGIYCAFCGHPFKIFDKNDP